MEQRQYAKLKIGDMENASQSATDCRANEWFNFPSPGRSVIPKTSGCDGGRFKNHLTHHCSQSDKLFWHLRMLFRLIIGYTNWSGSTFHHPWYNW